MTNPDEPTPSDWHRRAARTAHRDRLITTWLGLIPFVSLAVGGLVFRSGLRQYNPGPLGPGQVYCGNCVIGGFIVMMVGAPLAVIVSALVMATVGGVVGSALDDFDL
jgi:hypothetical protein